MKLQPADIMKEQGKVKLEFVFGQIGLCACAVAQLCLTLCNPVDYSPPGSFVHGIFQAGILEWIAIPFFKGSSQPRD